MLAAFPRRRPVAGGWPLLGVLGVHLLLAWSWRTPYLPAPDLRGERVIDLIPLPPSPEPPRTRREPPPPRSSHPGKPAARTERASADAAAAPEPVDPAPEVPASAADPFAITVPSAPAQSALDAMVGRAKRDAVIIDREMRKGKSGVPEVADTPMARFRRALEAAHKDRGLGVTSETYTAPDGQVIYRFRRGGKVKCRASGSVGPKIGGAVGGGEVLFDVQGGGGTAGEVRCPNHVEWKRD